MSVKNLLSLIIQPIIYTSRMLVNIVFIKLQQQHGFTSDKRFPELENLKHQFSIQLKNMLTDECSVSFNNNAGQQ